MNHALYVGRVAHRRLQPKNHGFSYPLFMWLFDLDELADVPEIGWWFSLRGPALSRLLRSDYLGDPQQPLASAVRQRLTELTGQPVTGRVCGLLHLRTLGLYFSPVNFYYGFDGDGRCSHFLAEVSNIPWGERHHYGHYLGDGNFRPEHGKAFHVSPFNPEDQHYRWTITPPGERLAVTIEVSDRRGEIFAATLDLARRPLTPAEVRRQLRRIPVMTAYIVAGIYYQALRLYLKGVPYIPYVPATKEVP